MREYKGRKVLKQISARLVPWGDSLPDCMCEILLTEDTVYVLEDEFNGEYTVLYAISYNHIEKIEKYRHIVDRYSSSEGILSPSKYLLSVFMGLIGGVIFIPNKKNSVQSTRIDYLRIIFIDETGKDSQLYFNDVAGSVRSFSKAFSNAKNSSIV